MVLNIRIFKTKNTDQLECLDAVFCYKKSIFIKIEHFEGLSCVLDFFYSPLANFVVVKWSIVLTSFFYNDLIKVHIRDKELNFYEQDKIFRPKMYESNGGICNAHAHS